MIPLAISLIPFGMATLIYFLYFIAVLRTKKKGEYIAEIGKILAVNMSQNLPVVTILIPAYNEAAGIRDKLKNLSDLDYSQGKD